MSRRPLLKNKKASTDPWRAIRRGYQHKAFSEPHRVNCEKQYTGIASLRQYQEQRGDLRNGIEGIAGRMGP